MGTFLSAADLSDLTGRKAKSKQIDVLRKMGLPFFVNACGKPVVTRTAVEGSKSAIEKSVSKWTMPG